MSPITLMNSLRNGSEECLPLLSMSCWPCLFALIRAFATGEARYARQTTRDGIHRKRGVCVRFPSCNGDWKSARRAAIWKSRALFLSLPLPPDPSLPTRAHSRRRLPSPPPPGSSHPASRLHPLRPDLAPALLPAVASLVPSVRTFSLRRAPSGPCSQRSLPARLPSTAGSAGAPSGPAVAFHCLDPPAAGRIYSPN